MVQNCIKRFNLLTHTISEEHVSHIKVNNRERGTETKVVAIPGWGTEKNV